MTEQLRRISDEHREGSPAAYGDLSALLLNCTLTRSPNLSHTEGLMGIAKDILETNGVAVDYLRPVDYEIPAGLKHDYAGSDGYDHDDWPSIQAGIDACDILIIGTSVDVIGTPAPLLTEASDLPASPRGRFVG